jgi:hypothetical protein
MGPQRPPDNGSSVEAPATASPTPRTDIAFERAARGSAFVDTVLAGLVPSLLGLTAYAILREAYVWFYQIYGVTPEEVGLDHLSMMTGTLRFLHLWVWSVPGSPALNFVLVLLAGVLLASLWERLLPRFRRRSRWVDWMARQHPVLLTLTLVLLLVLLMSAWALPRDRDFAGRRLQLGKYVRPTDLAFLSIHADPVEVAWVGTSPSPPGLVGTRLVYLGKADGIVVLYRPPDWSACPDVDACRGDVWRVREDDVALRFEINPPDRHAPARAALAGPAAPNS